MQFFKTLAVGLLAIPAALAQSENGIGSTPKQRHYIDLGLATQAIIAARNKALTVIPENIAIVDPSGLLVAFARMDNAFPASIDISQKKARTCVLFNGIPSDGLLQQAYSGGDLYNIQETNGGLVVFGGGFPIYKNGYLIGAIGVSGGTVQQDKIVAQAGVDAIGTTTQ